MPHPLPLLGKSPGLGQERLQACCDLLEIRAPGDVAELARHGHATVVPIVRHGDENTPPPPPTTKKGKRREV
jgi:hypothetical protein